MRVYVNHPVCVTFLPKPLDNQLSWYYLVKSVLRYSCANAKQPGILSPRAEHTTAHKGRLRPVKTQSKEKLALSAARLDADYILEPLVDGVMAERLEGKPLLH